jgi:hypothetical protein
VPRCAEASCGRWRPERLAPRWAAGIRLNGDWYCSRECVRTAARLGLNTETAPVTAPSLRCVRLGVLLRHRQAITQADLDAALDAQRDSGRRLGAELLRLQRVRGDQLLRALATQSNASYLTSFDLRRVKQGPAWLTAETVRALGLVPFDVDETGRRVHVICAAPVPRAAIQAMHRLTGWTPEVYLVHDDVWEEALREYAPKVTGQSELRVMTVGGIDAAASFVADTASVDRAVTMRHAQWDRFTWVRVEASTHVSNLLVPGVVEDTCQAAHTAH